MEFRSQYSSYFSHAAVSAWLCFLSWLNSDTSPNLQESTAKLEHARLRQLIKALLAYKEDLVIRLPTAAERPAGGGGDDEPGGPFRVCLEEDPAEAFLNFDEDVGKGAAAQPVPTGCQRRIHSAPAQTTGEGL